MFDQQPEGAIVCFEFPGEPDAVRKTVEYGSQYGYGNLIDRLKIAWALRLLETFDFDVGTAMRSALIEDKDRIARAQILGRERFIEWAKKYTYKA